MEQTGLYAAAHTLTPYNYNSKQNYYGNYWYNPYQNMHRRARSHNSWSPYKYPGRFESHQD